MKLVILAFLLGLSLPAGAAAPTVQRVATPELPLVRVALFFPFGSGSDAAGGEGHLALLSKWMEMGTKNKTPQQYRDALRSLGGLIDTEISPRYTLVSVEAPKETFIQVWHLALERLKEPRFDANDLEIARTQLKSDRKATLASWVGSGRQLAHAANYAGTRDAVAASGLESALEAPAETLKQRHDTSYAKGPYTLFVSSSADEALATQLTAASDAWTAPYQPEPPQPFQPKGRHLVLIERPGQTQTYLFFVKPGPVVGTAEHALASIAAQILGANGGNSGILFDELRAKRGLTYHASFQVQKRPKQTEIIGVTFGENARIDELASRYLEEWVKFYQQKTFPLTQLQEADIAYRALRERETGGTLENLLSRSAEAFSVTGKAAPIWQTVQIDHDAFIAAKQKWLSPEDMTIVAFGDAATVRDKLVSSLKPARTTVLGPNSDWDSVSKAVATSPASEQTP